MLNLYIAKVLDNAFIFLPKLSLEFQERVKKNKNTQKQKQMITAELLLIYALKDSGYEDEINVKYLPKPILDGSNLNISKSHSYDYVLVAVSKANVGVDIEKLTTVKSPERVLSKDELTHYNDVLENEKADIFSLYWTTKEAFIKYHGSLIKEYKEINFKIDKTINNFSAGKIDELYCYQSFFKDYSFSVVTSLFIAPNVIFVGKESF